LLFLALHQKLFPGSAWDSAREGPTPAWRETTVIAEFHMPQMQAIGLATQPYGELRPSSPTRPQSCWLGGLSAAARSKASSPAPSLSCCRGEAAGDNRRSRAVSPHPFLAPDPSLPEPHTGQPLASSGAGPDLHRHSFSSPRPYLRPRRAHQRVRPAGTAGLFHSPSRWRTGRSARAAAGRGQAHNHQHGAAAAAAMAAAARRAVRGRYYRWQSTFLSPQGFRLGYWARRCFNAARPPACAPSRALQLVASPLPPAHPRRASDTLSASERQSLPGGRPRKRRYRLLATLASRVPRAARCRASTWWGRPAGWAICCGR